MRKIALILIILTSQYSVMFATNPTKTFNLSPSSPNDSWTPTIGPSETATLTINIASSGTISGITYTRQSPPAPSITGGNVLWSNQGGTVFDVTNTDPDAGNTSISQSCVWNPSTPLNASGLGNGAQGPTPISGLGAATAYFQPVNIAWCYPQGDLKKTDENLPFELSAKDANGDPVTINFDEVIPTHIAPSTATVNISGGTAQSSSGTSGNASTPNGCKNQLVCRYTPGTTAAQKSHLSETAIKFLKLVPIPVTTPDSINGATNYIVSGDLVENLKLKTTTNFEIQGPPGYSISSITSSRNNTDALSVSSGTLDSDGKLKTVLTTRENINTSTTLSVNSLQFNSHTLNFPYKFEDKFWLTVYYTTMEEGFVESNGFIETTTTITAYLVYGGNQTVNITLNADFVNALKEEGMGRMITSVNGRTYIGYYSGKYYLKVYPVGNGSNQLVDKISCATYQKNIVGNSSKRAAVKIDDAAANSAFGNSIFRADDSGGAIKNNHIDLYWGEDWPQYSNASLASGTSYTGTGNDTYTAKVIYEKDQY